jgi:tetratricopeptide (TPR) repeat protein
MSNKKQSAAITDLNTFIELSNADQTVNVNDTIINYTSQAYMVRSFAKFELKDYQGALNDMNLYLSIPSNNAQDYLFRGKLYAQLNNHSDAILDFNKAIDVDSSYDQAYMYRGISKAELNQNDACSDLLKAKELGLKDTSQYLEKYCH